MVVMKKQAQRAAWGGESVKVNQNFNPKMLFDSD